MDWRDDKLAKEMDWRDDKLAKERRRERRDYPEEWELKIPHVFSCNNYAKEQKMNLGVAEFPGYALIC
ncbi:hypothetical protein Lal_00039464 [Lupinus albus]|nr:hypothetical protein Lal_00039464 [Lupinus albus]